VTKLLANGVMFTKNAKKRVIQATKSLKVNHNMVHATSKIKVKDNVVTSTSSIITSAGLTGKKPQNMLTNMVKSAVPFKLDPIVTQELQALVTTASVSISQKIKANQIQLTKSLKANQIQATKSLKVHHQKKVSAISKIKDKVNVVISKLSLVVTSAGLTGLKPHKRLMIMVKPVVPGKLDLIVIKELQTSVTTASVSKCQKLSQ